MNHNLLLLELFLLTVTAQLIGPDESVLDLSDPENSGTIFTYTAHVDSFGDSDVGNYTCSATVRLQPTYELIYLTGTGELSDTIEVIIGKKYSRYLIEILN